MGRVTVEEQEGVGRIQVNYTQETFIKILGAIFILLPAAIAVPIFSYDMVISPEMVPWESPIITLFLTCTAGGLLAWWLWSNHQQMMSITQQDGILEIVHAFKFLRFPRWYRLGDIFDVMKDAKRTEKPGDKSFLQMQSVGGQLVKITRPSIRITKNDVDRIYDALRPHVAQPPPAQRLRYFPHISVTESDSQTVITFRTRLHFISVRYFGILISMVLFLSSPVVITLAIDISLFPTFFVYPGLAVIGLILLLYLPFFLPVRKKHLVHNHNVATLQINKDRPTIAIHSSMQGVNHDYPSVPLKSIKYVPVHTDRELTFASETAAEYTSYYKITLDVGSSEEIYLYTTENHAEAMHVTEFLENLIPKPK